MKFKEIKPGMVIHCQAQENVWDLLKYLRLQGYRTCGIPAFDDCYIHIGADGVTWSGEEKMEEITEFSDLVDFTDEISTEEDYERAVREGLIPQDNSPTDSPMTAKEVLEWLSAVKRHPDAMEDAFGVSTFGSIFDCNTPMRIIEKITAYEAEKKKPIPVPVVTKWVQLCRIIQIQEDGTKKVVYEEELGYDPILAPKGQTAEILKCYISKHHDGRYIAVIEDVCRERLEGEA